jgi:4'-phosphopantetheinyl transferase
MSKSLATYLILLSDQSQVSVWWMRVNDVDATHYARWYVMLDAEERDRANRFFFDSDRLEYVAYHALLRSKLSNFGSRLPHESEFSADRFGKPGLAPEA